MISPKSLKEAATRRAKESGTTVEELNSEFDRRVEAQLKHKEETIEGPIKNFAVFIEHIDDSCEAIPELLGIYSLPAKAHEAARGYERDNDWAQCRVEEWEVE